MVFSSTALTKETGIPGESSCDRKPCWTGMMTPDPEIFHHHHHHPVFWLSPLVVVQHWHLVVTCVIDLRARAAGDNSFVPCQSIMQVWACWDQLKASASRIWNRCLRPTSSVWSAWSKKWCPTWRRGVLDTSWSWAASWAFRVCASLLNSFTESDILRIVEICCFSFSDK